MAESYDVDKCNELAAIIEQAGLYSTHAPTRYEAGHVFELDITGVHPATPGKARLEVEKFIGGGFAGQVYRVKLAELDLHGETIPGLEPGNVYAIKIIIPPSRFSVLFRNSVFWMAYQGPFAPQVNPSAARAGVLWQKLIRRGAKVRFGDEHAVADTYATFFEPGLGSYGEINEWIEGRNWQFEIDDHIMGRRKRDIATGVASQEFLAKKRFMAELVHLFHDMGAPELARQYEWWTCKSQPNVLKRMRSGKDAAPENPYDGLTALDFRAGLALLPFLPMSPADIKLIFKGLGRGHLVQFDRGNLDKLEAFCDEHAAEFDDLRPALEELKERDPEYRASLPDVTHHGLKPLYNRALRKSVKEGLVQGWRVRQFVDEAHAEKLSRGFFSFWLFALIGWIPFLGGYLRRIWGCSDYAKHVWATFTSINYMRRMFRARLVETLLAWYRVGRVGEERLDYYLRHPSLFWVLRFVPGILPLPATWHRFLAEPKFAWQTVRDAVAYPIRFYREADFRVEWLTAEIESGASEGMLTKEEYDHIIARVPDPYIQKYLKCVAVHVCTLPVTQVISVVAALWGFLVLGKTWQEGMVWALGILAAFQGTPISPGSLVRGTYVVYLMVKERNWRNYWIAVLVSYWHYIGYLGFPLQMVTEFPALARFMGGRWATRMVNHIPVFGERGALLEHFVFDLFFNVPLSAKRAITRKE